MAILGNILLGLATLIYLVPVQFFLTSRVSHRSVSGRKEYSSRPDKNPGSQLAGELNNGGSMSQFSYVAVNSRGLESRGSMDVSDQPEALRRIKEMGLHPIRLIVDKTPNKPRISSTTRASGWRRWMDFSLPGLGSGIKTSELATFTRNLSTLIEAGLPLLRGLRLLNEQEENRQMKGIIAELAHQIECGSTFAEALSVRPEVFNRLYLNMVKAGELAGALEVTLRRLAEFMEKAEKIKGKVAAALFYPAAVMFVAAAVVGVLLVFVLPQFKKVFEGMGGMAMPAFTELVFGISDAIKNHIPAIALGAAAAVVLFRLVVGTRIGRWTLDRCKLGLPALGPVMRKATISRFARTFGTLVSSGVPILQALTILRETSGNVVMADLVESVHQRVKEGEAIAPVLKASPIFPAMIAGMVDVGEQTGALPEMLMKIADNCDEQVDNATSAMTSLLEPALLVFLAVIVGSIVVAMFLPLIAMMCGGFDRETTPDS